MTERATRIERDFFGPIEVPAEVRTRLELTPAA
jgi:hypothetical protein